MPKIAVWARPSPPYYKINYDTVIRQDFSAQAAVYTDSRGTIIGYSTLISPPCSPIFSEATAALLACCLALFLELQHFMESDSFVVTLSLQNPNLTQDWIISSVISHIFSYTPTTTSWSTSHVNRSANFYAHLMVNWAAIEFTSSYILNYSYHLGSFPIHFGKESLSSFLVP